MRVLFDTINNLNFEVYSNGTSLLLSSADRKELNFSLMKCQKRVWSCINIKTYRFQRAALDLLCKFLKWWFISFVITNRNGSTLRSSYHYIEISVQMHIEYSSLIQIEKNSKNDFFFNFYPSLSLTLHFYYCAESSFIETNWKFNLIQLTYLANNVVLFCDSRLFFNRNSNALNK